MLSSLRSAKKRSCVLITDQKSTKWAIRVSLLQQFLRLNSRCVLTSKTKKVCSFQKCFITCTRCLRGRRRLPFVWRYRRRGGGCFQRQRRRRRCRREQRRRRRGSRRGRRRRRRCGGRGEVRRVGGLGVGEEPGEGVGQHPRRGGRTGRAAGSAGSVVQARRRRGQEARRRGRMRRTSVVVVSYCRRGRGRLQSGRESARRRQLEVLQPQPRRLHLLLAAPLGAAVLEPYLE